MNVFVLDTSVAIAWYLDERFSTTARTWQDRLLSGRIRILVPTLHYWEFANVLRTHVVRGHLDARLATEIQDLHLDAPLDLLEPERRTVLNIALEYGATAYDAVYIALALNHQAPLLTAEKTTTSWVTKLAALVEPIR